MYPFIKRLIQKIINNREYTLVILSILSLVIFIFYLVINRNRGKFGAENPAPTEIITDDSTKIIIDDSTGQDKCSSFNTQEKSISLRYLPTKSTRRNKIEKYNLNQLSTHSTELLITDSTKKSASDSVIRMCELKTDINNFNKTKEDEAIKKSATLGYSYSKKMKRFETQNINTYVSINFPESKIRDTLRKIIVKQPSLSDPNDTANIYTQNIFNYDSLQITLVDPSNDFKITKIHNKDTQHIDSIMGARWQWAITSSTDKPEAYLILKVVGIKIKGPVNDQFDDNSILIKIQLNNSLSFRTLIDYLEDNPKVSIPILVSLFGGMWLILRWRLGIDNKT